MSGMTEYLAESIASGLQNRTLNSCFRWASHRRIMGGDFAGPYSDKYHPWVREMHDSWAPFNWAMKGAQLGVTEVAINRALYTIDRLKRDVLYVLPTAKNASKFSKARFGNALALSPYLKDIFTDTNSVDLKQAGANSLYISGSRGDNNLKSIPASELILDELDEFDERAILLALERLSGQLHKHVWGISTPTTPNHGIHKQYLKSTQEHFMFKCPSCSRTIDLKWPDSVEICGEGVSDPKCHDSYLKCTECHAKLPHQDKPNFLSKAIWIPQAPNPNPEHRGFHISQLYSFTVTPGELVEAHHRGFGDEAASQEFHNSKLGLPFIGDGACVTDDMLNRALRHHTKDDPRPNRGGDRIITMGVDQGKWSYVEVCEWFFDQYSRDLNVSAHAKVLYEGKFHESMYDQELDRLMREWQVLACVIDADPYTMEARRFARRFPGYVWLCRYRKGVTAKEIAITEEEEDAPVATVDRTHWLSAALGRFKTDPPRIVLPADLSHEYREHVKNLVGRYENDEFGNPIYVYKDIGPDHFGHARAYAEIALPLVAMRVTNKDVRAFL
jgi:hypothetical protein